MRIFFKLLVASAVLRRGSAEHYDEINNIERFHDSGGDQRVASENAYGYFSGSLYKLGVKSLEQGNLKDAEAHFRHYIDLFPKGVENELVLNSKKNLERIRKELRQQELFNKVNKYFIGSSSEDNEECFLTSFKQLVKIIDKDFHFVELLNNLESSKSITVDNKIACLNIVLQETHGSSLANDIRVSLAIQHNKKGDFFVAEKYLKNVISKITEKERTSERSKDIFSLKGEVTLSIILEEIKNYLAPESWDILKNMVSKMFLDINNEKDKTALQAIYNNDDPMLFQGKLQLCYGNFYGALDSFKSYMERKNNDSQDALLWRGVAYYALGRKSEAIKDFKLGESFLNKTDYSQDNRVLMAAFLAFGLSTALVRELRKSIDIVMNNAVRREVRKELEDKLTNKIANRYSVSVWNKFENITIDHVVSLLEKEDRDLKGSFKVLLKGNDLSRGQKDKVAENISNFIKEARRDLSVLVGDSIEGFKERDRIIRVACPEHVDTFATILQIQGVVVNNARDSIRRSKDVFDREFAEAIITVFSKTELMQKTHSLGGRVQNNQDNNEFGARTSQAFSRFTSDLGGRRSNPCLQ